MTTLPISAFLKAGTHVHFVGIGGVSMAPLAQVLHEEGVKVTGSDMRQGDAVMKLQQMGIHISIGHKAENIAGAACIIRTAAAHEDNPEIAAARKANIPVFERAEGWGAIMQGYRNALCIAGTHGKTSTTSMCAQIFMQGGCDPTVMVGGSLSIMGGGHRVGKGDTIILESCEYCNSYHSFFPSVAVVLNIDVDHLDFFKDLNDIKQSFRTFAEKVPQDRGVVIYNADDANCVHALAPILRKTVTFGIKHGDVRAENLVWDRGTAQFDVVHEGAVLTHIVLHVPGEHNVYNALAAVAAAMVLQVPMSAAQAGLSAFRGAGRRFEYKGEYGGAKIYDDYAHHPSEIKQLLKAVSHLGYRRIICAFQPHTYTRTQELFDDFIDALSLCDQVILAEIFAARENNESGISSADLAEKIPNSLFCPTLDDVAQAIKLLASPGDLVLTVGAGNINTVSNLILDGGNER